jgi:hypothetical protein
VDLRRVATKRGGPRAPVAKWLTRWSAKPVFAGSIPARCSMRFFATGNKYIVAKENHYKRFFHVPRAQMMSIQAIQAVS